MTDLDHLNALYREWKDAQDAAWNAQHDIVLFMQHHLHGNQDAPPLSMQTASDSLWQVATERQAELSRYFNDRLK